MNKCALKLYQPKDFLKHFKRLSRKGGMADAVFRQVNGAIALWSQGQDPQLPNTHHGETRIPHVVKYDLKAFYRLVAYEHAGKRVLLMVGSHDEVEKWLNANRGRDFATHIESGRVHFTIAEADDEVTAACRADSQSPAFSTGAILDDVPDEVLARMNLSVATLRLLKAEVTYESIDEERTWDLISALAFPSEEHRNVMVQVVSLLANRQRDTAIQRIEVFCGQAETASANPSRFAAALESGENSETLIELSRLSEAEIRHLLSAEGLADWMLYLHPDQRKQVERDYSGPARLVGVSGSGKTSVLVHRANRLAQLYHGERVLILSLNAALCQLIEKLLGSLCVEEVRSRIDVLTIYEYCYSAVKIIDQTRLIEKMDPRSGEDLEACWRDFMDKPHALDSVKPFLDALSRREEYVDGSLYVFDELVWIRSGFGRENRSEYLQCDRPGRGIALPRYEEAASAKQKGEPVAGIPYDTRWRLLQLLDDYEEYMLHGGLLDDDGVSLEAYAVREQIAKHKSLRARCVLVDEVQDCSTVELAVIAKIPIESKNGLFITGDPVQKVFPKQHDLSAAGIDIVGRSTVLRRNYRNSRQILEAAFRIIEHYREIAAVPKEEILEPEYAYRDGSRPSLYECESREQQCELVMWHLGLLPETDYDATCVSAITEEGLSMIEVACARAGIRTCRIVNEIGKASDLGNGVKLCLMSDLKGYEFRSVFLVDLVDSKLIPRGMPYEERWRIAFQLYVAMTRARDELVMSYVYNRSILLGPLEDAVNEGMAGDLLNS